MTSHKRPTTALHVDMQGMHEVKRGGTGLVYFECKTPHQETALRLDPHVVKHH